MIYHVKTSGYDGYITMNIKELNCYVKDETKRARRYFGTAVAHKVEHNDGELSFDITARRDKNSARWIHILAVKH